MLFVCLTNIANRFAHSTTTFKEQPQVCARNHYERRNAHVAVTLAGLLTASHNAKTKLSDMRFLFYGAGSATLGIVELIVEQCKEEGLSNDDACKQIFLMDSKGLSTKQR